MRVSHENNLVIIMSKTESDFIPFDEEAYKKWAMQAATRIHAVSQRKPLQLKLNGILVGELAMNEIIHPNPDGQGTTVDLGEAGIKRRGDLVGMGGAYYHPYFFGADNADAAIESWNWLFDQSTLPKKDIETDLEMMLVLDFIRVGMIEPTVFKILALATDLHRLYKMGIDVSKKVSEVNEKIRGNIKQANKLKEKNTTQYLLRLEHLTYQLADMASESRLALFAKTFGFDVKLQKSPDVLINDVRVEVKHVWQHEMDIGSFVNKITKGFKQRGQIVVIETGDFRNKSIKSFQIKWLPTMPLSEALRATISAAKNGRKCVLLFAGTNKGYIGKWALIK